jgi:hypothetical protein
MTPLMILFQQPSIGGLLFITGVAWIVIAIGGLAAVSRTRAAIEAAWHIDSGFGFRRRHTAVAFEETRRRS